MGSSCTVTLWKRTVARALVDGTLLLANMRRDRYHGKFRKRYVHRLRHLPFLQSLLCGSGIRERFIHQRWCNKLILRLSYLCRRMECDNDCLVFRPSYLSCCCQYFLLDCLYRTTLLDLEYCSRWKLGRIS